MLVAGFGEIMLRLATNKGIMISNANNFDVCYGGGEANVLISLSKFGIDTRMISKLPNNDLGQSVIDYLNSHRINTEFIEKSDGRLGIYFLEVGSGNRASKVIYDRSDSVFSKIKVDDFDIEKALDGVDVFHFSGITLALSQSIRILINKILKYCKENKILVSYDSNYRAKLWTLEEASEATLEILPYINILSAGILDFENIFGIKIENGDKSEKLKYYYDEISRQYSNIKHLFSSSRNIKSSTVNYLQCNYYVEGNIYTSKVHIIDDIVDRVGGGDALTAGMLYGIINNKEPQYISEFAVAASVLKHSIKGDANLVCIDDVESLIEKGVGKILR